MDPVSVLQDKQLILLDFDGPICDIIWRYSETYRRIINELMGLPQLEAQLLSHRQVATASFGEFCQGMYRIARSRGITPRCNLETMSSSWDLWSDLDELTPYVAGSLEALACLKRLGKSVVVVSNRKASSFVRHYPALSGIVDVVLMDDQGRNFPPKPDPAMIYHASDLTGIPLYQAVMFGDGPSDWEAAGNAGVPYIEVLNGYAGRPRHYPATRVPNLATLVGRILYNP